MRKMLAAFCFFAACSAALAQDARPPDSATTPQWTEAEIETIQASTRPGPAVWRVTKGDSEVWILATVGPLPKNFSWNKDYVADLFDGARAVITPPGIGVGVGDGVWLLINYGNRLSLPRGQALEATLEAPMRARFADLRATLGKDEERYRTDSPFRAAIRLSQDFRDKAQLTGDNGIYEIGPRVATLTGRVVLTKEKNVMRGAQLTVDMVTGVAKLGGGVAGSHGRVEGIFTPPPQSGDK